MKIKVEYEICDICKEKLPNNPKTKKLMNFIFLMVNVPHSIFYGIKVSSEKHNLIFCEKCWNRFNKTFKGLEKELK